MSALADTTARQPVRYQPVIDRNALRSEEIARLDAASRTRALTDAESTRLQNLIYRERYAEFRSARRTS